MYVLKLLVLGALALATSPAANDVSSPCLGSGARSSRVGRGGSYWPWQNYETADFQPPELEIETTGQPLAPGYLFFAPSNSYPSAPPATKRPGPLIMSDTNDLVWSSPSSLNTTNFRVQELNGEPVLTFWSGFSTSGANQGHGYGTVHILNKHYETLYVLNPKLGLNIEPKGNYTGELDLHESYITPSNTMIFTAYNITTADLTSVGGPKNGWVDDCQFYEIDIASGKILFKWSSIEHVPVSDSKVPLAKGVGTKSSHSYDYFHINSVQPVGENYLINSRYTWSTYLISRRGKVLWTLQGDTGGDFGPPPIEGRFEWQHEARAFNVTENSVDITWFNNRNQPLANGTHQSNALGLHLKLPPSKSNPPKLTARLLNIPKQFSISQGSYETLDNGHQVVGFGSNPLIREYGPPKTNEQNRNTLWSARFGENDIVQSFRAYKTVWHGAPKTKPALVVKGKVSPAEKNPESCRQAYVSWNGATDIEEWNIYEGQSKQTLKKVGTIEKKGFETSFGVEASRKCVQAGAVSERQEVSRSEIVCS